MAGCSHFVHPPEMLTHWGPDSTEEARTDLPQVPGTSPLHVASGLWAGPASLARQLGDYSWHFTESSRPLANLFTEAPQTGRGLANKAGPGFSKWPLKARVHSRLPGPRWLAGVRGFHPHGTRWPPRKPPASQHCISLKQRNLISLNQSLDVLQTKNCRGRPSQNVFFPTGYFYIKFYDMGCRCPNAPAWTVTVRAAQGPPRMRPCILAPRDKA